MSPGDLEVTGGAAGLTAQWHHLAQLAGWLDDSGNRLRDWAASDAAALTDADLVASALLSPFSFTEVETRVAAAISGPDGLLPLSVGFEADAAAIRTTSAGLQQCDQLVAEVFTGLDHALGFGLGATLPIWASLIGAWWLTTSPAERNEALTDHPDLIQHLVAGSGGLVAGALGLPWAWNTPLSTAAGGLGWLYPDGRAQVRRRRDLERPITRAGNVTGLISRLDDVASLAADAEDRGTIAVQTLRDDNGVRHVVYLPGTDDLTTLPWTTDADVRDLGTNLSLIAGHDDAYRDGIVQAIYDAGVDPGEPILLVGHSQGGMEAASIISDPGTGLDVTHAITAGSPTAQVPGFPPGTHVLSLENHGDLVPSLDGADNPDSVEQTTVRFDAGSHDGGTGVTGHHSLGAYLAGAAAIDASTDPSVAEQIDSLTAAGFVGDRAGVHTSTQVFQITRALD